MQNRGRTSWPNRAAVLLCAAGTGLSVVLAGLFRITEGGITPVLRPWLIPDAQWLAAPSAGYESAAAVQWSSVFVTSAVVFSVLLCAVLVAVIAFCTLVLTRFSLRRTEIATRAALGAAPLELVREVARPVVRLLLLGAVIGTALGSALALAAAALWPAQTASSLYSIVLRGLLSGVICAVLQGSAAVSLLWLFLVRRNLADSLRTGERATGGLAETRVRELLTVAQVAACMVLLTVGLALAGRAEPFSAIRLQDENLVAVWSAEPGAEGESRTEQAAHLERLLQARKQSAVPAESLASSGALLGVGPREWLLAECDNCMHMDHALITIHMHSVGPGYFTLLGNAFLRGRDFAAADRIGAQPVVIVNDSFVKRMFGPSGSGLGRQVWLGVGMGEPHRIVGVIPDQDGYAPGASPRGQAVIYFAALQHPPLAIDRVARGSGPPPPPAVTLPALRAAAAAPVRSAALTIQSLMLLCIGMAAYGLYATTATLLRGRRRELGVRVALGSTPAGLTRYVAGYGARLLFVGLLFGGWLAFAAQRLLASALPGAQLDARSFLLALLTLIGAVLYGAFVPARQAGREQPGNPLRG